VVSSQPEAGQVPAIRLLTREALVGTSPIIPDRDTKLAPVGRLDMDSRGLLILSEDGVVAKAVIGPQSELDKEYQVRVSGEITERALGLLRHGLALDGRQLKPATVTLIGPQQLRFILTEGRNRQIRRMCELVGLGVTDLFRIRIGPLKLGDLPERCWRVLTAQERQALLGR
jgi:23S rRNA pseudouridine2604 synthase